MRTHFDVAGLITIIVFALHAALIPMSLRGAFLHGDEPVYLETAASLARDFDLNISNRHERRPGEDGAWPPAGHCYFSKINPGAVYSLHNIGLPALAAPFHALMGETGILILLSLASALLSANIYLLAAQYCRGWFAPAAVTAAVSASAPVFVYAHHLYPATFLALAGVAGYRLASAPGGLSPWRQFYVGALAAAAAWLNYKNTSFALALTCVAVFRIARVERGRVSPLLFLPHAASLGLMLWINHQTGNLTAALTTHGDKFYSPVNGAMGMLVDQANGLFFIAPATAVVFAAMGHFAGERRREFIEISVLCLSVYLPSAMFVYWHGAWSPPGRYMLEILPLLCAPIAFAFELKRAAPLRLLFLALFPLNVYIGWSLFANPMYTYMHIGGGSDLVAGVSALRGITVWLPRLSTGEMRETVLGAAWLAAAVAANVILFYADGKGASPSARRGD